MQPVVSVHLPQYRQPPDERGSWMERGMAYVLLLRHSPTRPQSSQVWASEAPRRRNSSASDDDTAVGHLHVATNLQPLRGGMSRYKRPRAAAWWELLAGPLGTRPQAQPPGGSITRAQSCGPPVCCRLCRVSRVCKRHERRQRYLLSIGPPETLLSHNLQPTRRLHCPLSLPAGGQWPSSVPFGV